MAEIKIFHHKERAYVSDALNVYMENHPQMSKDWKAWLEHLLQGLQTENNEIQVEDKNNYIQVFYDMVLADYLNDEFRRARNSPTVINGFVYGNKGHFLSGWKL